MKLVVEELGQSGNRLRQEIRSSSDRHVVAIRPHIYRHNNPAGSLKIQVRTQDDQLIKESSPVAIAAIGSQQFFHGYIRFDINVSLRANQIYVVELVGSGYTFGESDYIGFCKDFDLRKYEADFEPNDGTASAYDLEIWYLKETL